MLSREDIFKSRDHQAIWQKYCGFFNLSLPEFMEIQDRLLMEQIDLVADSPLGKRVFKGGKPGSVREFRQTVPLTNYWTGYADMIGEEGTDEMLPAKPLVWVHTSGRGGHFKWIPWTRRALERYADATVAQAILACADRRGEVNLSEGARFLSILPPAPYISGITAWALAERFRIKLIPPPEIAEKLEFQERIALGFKMAFAEGVDLVGAVSSVLVKFGEALTQRSRGMSFSLSMLRPAVLLRMLRAYIIAKKERRSLLPRDLWPVKGLACGGTDTRIYREQVKYYWGKTPHESYGMSEAGIIAVQNYNRKDMSFYPYCAFLEFIPEEDWLRNREDASFQPSTVLIDELEPGNIYEVVITNFYGMPLVRYRPGDLIRVTALEDPDAGTRLPQADFFSRADGLLDLYGVVRLDEKTLWQAIEATGVPIEEWSARKEYDDSTPVLRIYIEPKGEAGAKANAAELADGIHRNLQAVSSLYTEAITEQETNPVRASVLPSGSFQRYYERRAAEGADLAHLKPPHMNAPDAVIVDLTTSGQPRDGRGAT